MFFWFEVFRTKKTLLVLFGQLFKKTVTDRGKMKNYTFYLVVLLSCTLLFRAQAQSSGAKALSIKECLEYASENNYNLRIARLDETISDKRIIEVRSTGLPQANINGVFEDRLKIPLLIIPNMDQFMGGGQGGIPMGYQYNSSLSGEVSQMIYDQTFWTGLKAAKSSTRYYAQNSAWVNENTAYTIADAYYKVIVIEKQLALLNINLSNTTTTLSMTELQFNNGLAKKVDINRLRVSKSNLESQIKQSELNLEQAYNNLKFQMGMPLNQAITLRDTTFELSEAELKSGETPDQFFDKRLDYKLLETSLELQKLDQKSITNQYFPRLTGFANYSYVGQGPDLGLYKTKNNDWVDYTTASIGLRLSIPVFDGLRKSALVQQSKVKQDQLKQQLDLKKQQIDIEVSNAEIQYKNTYHRIASEQENVDLAEEVYNVTQLEFKEGVGTSTDVVNAEFALRQAQNIYIGTLLELYTARLQLEKAKGNIINYLTSNSQ